MISNFLKSKGNDGKIIKTLRENLDDDVISIIAGYSKCFFCNKIGCKKVSKYRTMDNGRRDIKTHVSHLDMNVKVYYKKKELLNINFDEIFIGEGYYRGRTDKSNDGTSILIRKGVDYYFITADSVNKYKFPDKILKVYATVGNSSVSYPVVVGAKNTYFLLNEDKMYIKNVDLLVDEEFKSYIKNGDKKGAMANAYSAYYFSIKELTRERISGELIFSYNRYY